ncbi:zinc transporter ZIP10 isoform X2 [Callorhinchus milii]|uniref:Solute carrier family 39 member 10 n=1 Tax=Callorhinchus milii TaxID=7868 RepID=A0A4W3JGV7_CALMI|nr:zinc transporter ZIP10 isoform X2 [Callorhinchus milii]|eukprot:gi/632946049/ref/XP_007888365.1/ PREDICTED: zinc transporter ZIP10 isoform X2 [Callorhinchus milii]
MKVHLHTKFCFICLLTFLFHHCHHCHDDHHHDHDHNHGTEENHLHKHNDYQISEESYLQNNPTKVSLQNAESKQMYYIQKLFSYYGENGKLTFHGLEKLLTSLGLGEVKVVDLEHDNDGHDHVSHLDLLEAVERKHVHSHSHSHHTGRVKTVPNPKVKGSRCTRADSKNIRSTLKPATVEVAQRHHRHHHRHHHHRTSPHPSESTVNHKDGEQFPESSGPNVLHEKPQRRSRKSKKHKVVLKQPEGTFTPSPVESLTALSTSDHDNDLHVHEEKTTHQPRAKKDLGTSKLIHEEHLEAEPGHDECLNVSQLLQHYGLSTDLGISPEEFTYLCPALIYQIDSRACIKHHKLNTETADNEDSALSAWIWGLISVTIISLLSVLGVVLVPIINQVCFKFLLTFLVALAVGTLSGDALLHLMPHAQGGHDHSHDAHHHDHGQNHTQGEDETTEGLLTTYNALWKGLTALGGIYLLFIIEHCIGIFRDRRTRKGKKRWLKKKSLSGEAAVGRKLSDHKLNRRSEGEWLDLKTMGGADQLDVSGEKQDVTQVTDIDCNQETSSQTFRTPEENAILPHGHTKNLKAVYIQDPHDVDYIIPSGETAMSKKHRHSHSHHSHHSHGHCHSNKEMQDADIANIAWMVIMGDGMHNFSDGLAIGAAFSASITGGLSTSIAVFCHELPHELGDFAVLINAGMSVKQAIVYNVLSALLAYVGVVIGIAVGQYTHNLTQWIFAITAGMFLYVALVDMLPEMLHSPSDNQGQAWFGHFVLQNAGMLCGFTIMLLIAIFEDHIVINF